MTIDILVRRFLVRIGRIKKNGTVMPTPVLNEGAVAASDEVEDGGNFPNGTSSATIL